MRWYPHLTIDACIHTALLTRRWMRRMAHLRYSQSGVGFKWLWAQILHSRRAEHHWLLSDHGRAGVRREPTENCGEVTRTDNRVSAELRQCPWQRMLVNPRAS